MNQTFDFEKFVKQNAESDTGDFQKLVNSPDADNVGEYCEECVLDGYKEMSSRFTDDEITFISALVMSTAISFEMKNSGDLSSFAIVLGSGTV